MELLSLLKMAQIEVFQMLKTLHKPVIFLRHFADFYV